MDKPRHDVARGNPRVRRTKANETVYEIGADSGQIAVAIGVSGGGSKVLNGGQPTGVRRSQDMARRERAAIKNAESVCIRIAAIRFAVGLGRRRGSMLLQS